MQTSGEDNSKQTFQGMMAQVQLYLSRVALYPFHWGIHDGAPITEDWRPRLFRYDVRRLSKMIDMAEHMIRCLIIWLAYRKMRDEGVTPRRHFLPTPPPACARTRQAPIDHRLAARCVPLFDVKPPLFRISMPEDRSSLRDRQTNSPESALFEPPVRESKPGRLRNDDILSDDRLYLRLDRLDALYASIEARALRLAARWAGQMIKPDIPYAVQHESDAAQVRRKHIRSSEPNARGTEPPAQCSGPAALPFRSPDIRADMRTRAPPRPIKTYGPPPDWLDLARPDEAEDLHILHDAAIRAAEGFPALCG